MNDITQPFVTLSKANADSITRFAQSPEVTALATTSAEKYFELVQKSFGGAVASGAQADLIRRLTENYTTFAKEYSESLAGIASDAQAQVTQQVQAVTDRMAETAKTSAAAIADASTRMTPAKAK